MTSNAPTARRRGLAALSGFIAGLSKALVVFGLVAHGVAGVSAETATRGRDPTPVRVTLDDPPGSIRAEEGLERVAQEVARRWPDDSRGIAARFGLTDPAPVEIVLLHGQTFRGWARGFLPEWGVGFASWPDGPIVLDVDATFRGQKDLGEILRHEISHVYLGQRVAGTGLPRWFVEGVAQSQSGEWRFLDTMSLIQAASVGKLPELSRIGGSFPSGGRAAHLAYLVSLQAAVDLDARLREQGGVVALVDATAATGRFDRAMEDLLGMTPKEYSREFDSRARVRYGWIAAVANIGTLFTAMTLLFLLGAARAYWRKSRRMAEMEAEESNESSASA